MKKAICCVALLAALMMVVGVAAAENPAVVRSQGIAGLGHVGNSAAPKYCKPCLFYGGDWNSTASDWAAFGNDDNPNIPDDFENFSPFTVKKAAHATGLFTNNLSSIGCTIDPKKALWSIHTKMSSGNAGTTVASGEAAATFVATGRTYSSYTECTASVKIKSLALKPKTTYWEQVTPECSSTTGDCSGAYYYETDTFNSAGTGQGSNKVGEKEPSSLNFAYSVDYSYDYVNDCTEGYGSPACNWMSDGVVGK